MGLESTHFQIPLFIFGENHEHHQVHHRFLQQP